MVGPSPISSSQRLRSSGDGVGCPRATPSSCPGCIERLAIGSVGVAPARQRWLRIRGDRRASPPPEHDEGVPPCSGTSRIRVGTETVELSPGSVVIVDPGEPHTFLANSPDYLHFVLHIPPNGPELDARKVAVERSELGL